MRHVVTSYLRDHDIRAISASRREEVLTLLTREQPDLVILDLRLGQEDGLDLLRAWSGAFPASYQEDVPGSEAVADLTVLSTLDASDAPPLAVRLDGDADHLDLALYGLGARWGALVAGLIVAFAYDRWVTDSPQIQSQTIHQFDSAIRFAAPKHAYGKDLLVSVFHAYRWDQQYGTKVNSFGTRAMNRFGDFYEGPPPEAGQSKDDAYVQSNQMNWALSNIIGDIPQS